MSPQGQEVSAHVVVTTTVPDEAVASRLAESVVAERLAACAQVQGPVASVFPWRGSLDRAVEWYVHCKTTAAAVPRLTARLCALHPYEVPEIIATPIVGGHPPYLRWLEEMVGSEGRSEE